MSAVMYELIPAGPRTYYIDSLVKLGIYLQNDTQAILIDSGLDRDTAKKILKILQEQNWTLEAIVNTHSHADHIGGNHYLQEKTGCRIYTRGMDAPFTRFPLLEPSLLYGGAPFRELQGKFLIAQSSQVLDTSDPTFPAELEIIPLEGHSFDMFGIRTPDNVVFLADSVFCEAILNKYHISYMYNVEWYLNTLDRLETLEATRYIPAHAAMTDDIRLLIRINRAKTEEIINTLLDICEQPSLFEHILQRIFTHYELSMSYEQYVLLGSTLRSYLSYLKDKGRIQATFRNNLLYWETR